MGPRARPGESPSDPPGPVGLFWRVKGSCTTSTAGPNGRETERQRETENLGAPRLMPTQLTVIPMHMGKLDRTRIMKL